MTIGQDMGKLFDLMPADVRRRFEDEEKKRAEMREQIRIEAALAVRYLSEAIGYPNIARYELETARKHLEKALSVAAVLDPEDEAA